MQKSVNVEGEITSNNMLSNWGSKHCLCCGKLLFCGTLYLDDIPAQKASFLSLDSNKETSAVLQIYFFLIPPKDPELGKGVLGRNAYLCFLFFTTAFSLSRVLLSQHSLLQRNGSAASNAIVYFVRRQRI